MDEHVEIRQSNGVDKRGWCAPKADLWRAPKERDDHEEVLNFGGISVMRHNELSVLIGSQAKMDQLRRQDAETYAMSKAGQERGLEGNC